MNTNVIWPLSCIECAVRNISHHFSEGDVPYRNMQSKYPNWENPPWAENRPAPLKVREYIFYHKQAMLHEMYPPTVVCPTSPQIIAGISCITMPAEYARDMQSLKQALEADLNQNR